MKKGFENAFMDAQSRNVALCVELLENSNIDMDKAFIYMYQSDVQDFYNAFFAKDGRIYRVNELFSDEQINEFFDCGIDDIENIIEVCASYEHKCPHELMLTYDINTKSFDAEYEYEDCMLDEDMGLVERFTDWINKCKQSM